MFEKVRFQTGPCSFGTGIIIATDHQTDYVKVLEDTGEFWCGSIERIELENEPGYDP